MRNRQFKKHPVTKDNRIKALIKYVAFNVLNRFRAHIKYNWIGNLSFYASKGDGGIVGNIYYGLYELNESLLILHYLREEDTFLDVGANVGHYSLLASGIKNCQTIAIEPVPDTFKKLNGQVELNNLGNRILTLNMGVGDRPSELYFSTDKNTMNRIVESSYEHSVQVPVDTLDTICNERRPSILKIDVEGYEKFVLEGAGATLTNEKLKVVVIEINFSNSFYGIENEEVSQILINHGFKPYEYNPFKRQLIELKSYNQEQFNTIFVRDLEFVAERLTKSQGIKVWNKIF